MTSKGVIPNPYNQLLKDKHADLHNAQRFALSTTCDPVTGAPVAQRVSVRRQLKTIIIDAATAGDNIIIPASAGVKQIYEVVVWNVTAQTLMFQQGSTIGGNPIRLLRLTGFPALSGHTLGFNGNFKMPHWEIDNNQALVLNLQNSTQVDGFVRYRVSNGTAEDAS